MGDAPGASWEPWPFSPGAYEQHSVPLKAGLGPRTPTVVGAGESAPAHFPVTRCLVAAPLSRADISQAWGTQSSVPLPLSHAHPGLSPPTQSSHGNGLRAGFRSCTGRQGVTGELSNELGTAQGVPPSASPCRCWTPVLLPPSCRMLVSPTVAQPRTCGRRPCRPRDAGHVLGGDCGSGKRRLTG